MSLSLISFLVVMIRVVGVVLQALIIVVLANALSIAEMGLFSAVYVFWTLMRNMGPLGLDHLSMRDIATFASRPDSTRAQAVSNLSVLWVGAAGLTVALVSGAVLYGITGGGKALYTIPAIVAAALGAPAYAMKSLMSAHLRGFGRTIRSQAPEVMVLHAVVLAVLGALAYRDALTLERALLVQAGAAWLVLAAYAVLRARCGVDLTARLDADTGRRTISDAFQIWQAQCLGGLNDRAPAYVCLALLGPAATAIVDIAYRFGTLPSIFTDGVATTFAPVFAQRHAEADPENYRAALTLGSWLAFLPAASALVGLLAVGPWLIARFFPPSYEAAYWPMVLVCAGATTNAAFGLASNTFMVTGRQTLVRLYTAYSFAFVAAASAILGWLFGPIGIAAAVALGALVRDGGLARVLARDIGGPVMLDPRLPRRMMRTAWAIAR